MKTTSKIPHAVLTKAVRHLKALAEEKGRKTENSSVSYSVMPLKEAHSLVPDLFKVCLHTDEDYHFFGVWTESGQQIDLRY